MSNHSRQLLPILHCYSIFQRLLQTAKTALGASRFCHLCLILCLASVLVGGEAAIAANLRDRVFLPMELTVLQTVPLPQATRPGDPIQSWTGLTYDRQQNHFYSLATLPTDKTLYLATLTLADSQALTPDSHFLIKTLIPLQTPDATWYPHSLALSPEGTVFVTGSRVPIQNSSPNAEPLQDLNPIPEPFICEFALVSGLEEVCLTLPERYRLQALPVSEPQPPVSPDLPALGALTLVASGSGATGIDPFPLFMVMESARKQDIPATENPAFIPVRWLQALMNSGDRPFWLAEYAYPLDAMPGNRLEALLALGQTAQFLSVEASQDPGHPQTRIYQVAVSNAMDTSRVERLDQLSMIKPLKKKALLDLTEQFSLGELLVNDITFGPRLGSGKESIFLMGANQVMVLQVDLRSQTTRLNP